MPAATNIATSSTPARDTWWARERREPRTSLQGCATEGCHGELPSPFDLYCDAATPHFATIDATSRLQLTIVYALRAGFGGLALAAATLGSPAPLYVAAALAGLLLLLLPLRAFPTSRMVAIAAWLAVVSYLVANREAVLSDAARDYIVFAAVAVVLAGLPLAVLLRIRLMKAETPSRQAIATGLAVAVALTMLAVATMLGIDSVGGGIPKWALIGALGTAGGAIGAAAISGLLQGSRSIDYDPSFAEPAAFAAPEIAAPNDPTPPATQAFGDRILRMLQLGATRLAQRMVAIANFLLRLLWHAATRAVRDAKMAIHIARTWLVRLCLLLAHTVRTATQEASRAGGMVAMAGQRWAISTVTASILVVVGGLGAITAAGTFAAYLDGGTVAQGLASITLAMAAAAVLVPVSWALTRWPPHVVARATFRNAENAAPSVFLTAVTLGWITGIAGLLGFGPLRPGWLTFAGTLLLILSVGYAMVRARSQPAKS